MRPFRSSVLRRLARPACLAAVATAACAPAWAADSIALPEPDSLTLLAIGVTGLLIGQRIARRRD